MSEPKNKATLSEVLGDYKESMMRGLLFVLRANKLPEPVLEYEFHPHREWRFDGAYIEEKVAVEIEGGTGQRRDKPSRHLTPSGFDEDAIKYAEAAILGWAVIRLTPRMIRDGTGVGLIGRALEARRGV